MSTIRFKEANHLVAPDDPRLRFGRGWHPFPIPDRGFYDILRVKFPPGELLVMSAGSWFYWDNKHCARVRQGLEVIGRRVDKMLPGDGWFFRFRPGTESWRPFAITYGFDANGSPVPASRTDISNQLPMARCKDEALYLVRAIPQRWPIFQHIHVEYTEEPHQS